MSLWVKTAKVHISGTSSQCFIFCSFCFWSLVRSRVSFSLRLSICDPDCFAKVHISGTSLSFTLFASGHLWRPWVSFSLRLWICDSNCLAQVHPVWTCWKQCLVTKSQSKTVILAQSCSRIQPGFLGVTNKTDNTMPYTHDRNSLLSLKDILWMLLMTSQSSSTLMLGCTPSTWCCLCFLRHGSEGCWCWLTNPAVFHRSDWQIVSIHQPDKNIIMLHAICQIESSQNSILIKIV